MNRAIPLLLIMALTPAAEAGRYTESDLGTLFTTPAERAASDSGRLFRTGERDAPQRVTPSSVRVDGLVKRSGGGSTVWVNGRSNIDSTTVGGVKVPRRQGGKDSVTVYVDGQRVKIRPGETWSNKTADNR